MILTLGPLAVMVLGALIWALAKNGKVAQAGFVLFACGAFFVTWGLGGSKLHLGP